MTGVFMVATLGLANVNARDLRTLIGSGFGTAMLVSVCP